MNFTKFFTVTLFIIFLSLTSIAYTETLKFDSSTYEGETKKGKAHGVGIFTFSDGSTYVGKVKRNKIHDKGKYTDAQGNIYEGKWKYGKIYEKIDNKTRKVHKLNALTGSSTYFEKKGKGHSSSRWFEVEPIKINKKKIKLKTIDDLDFFPIFMSEAYGDEEKILEILNLMNQKIINENSITARDPKNLKTVYQYTAKSKREMAEIKLSANSSGDDSHNNSGSMGSDSSGSGAAC